MDDKGTRSTGPKQKPGIRMINPPAENTVGGVPSQHGNAHAIAGMLPGARSCLVCGGVERPGEVRHAYVHATSMARSDPAYFSSFPRGPFYEQVFVRTSSRRRRGPAHRRRAAGRTIVLKIGTGVFGASLVGGSAYGVTNWVIGLGSGSSGEVQAATVSNLAISAVASPSPVNLLYPGASGDVVLSIVNTNVFPVTITGVDLPTNTTYATGYTTSALSTSISGCSSANSTVTWNYSSATTGSVHALSTPLTVGANSSLAVTLSSDAFMSLAAPAACEGAFFSMPALTGIVASGGAAASTTSPATDSWTS